MKKNIILITGVAGMVGSNLLDRYIGNNKNIIIGIDNYELGQKKNIENFLKFKNFFFFKIDLGKKILNHKLSRILYKNILSNVWLLASNSDINKGISNSNIDLKNTFLTTVNTLEFIKPYLNEKTKILFTSTSAVYGDVRKTIKEDNTSFNPISNYGSMKLASESFISSYSHLYNTKCIIFRFPNVVGKNLTHGLLFDMKKKILNNNKFIQVLGNGKQTKPYSNVSEIIDCMIFINKINLKNKYSTFNIGTDDQGINVKKIVELMLKKYNSKKKILYQKSEIGWKGDIKKYRYSTQKIKKLGFNFKLNSHQSILKAIEENI